VWFTVKSCFKMVHLL